MKLLLAGCFAALLVACKSQPETQDPEEQPFPVQVSTPQLETLALTKTYTGRFAAVSRVEVRARVSGYIESIDFTEGSYVEKGDPLFKIDPDLFEAELKAAQAGLEEAAARQSLAERNAERADDLIQKRIISREDFDSRKAEVRRAAANRKLAEARLEQARLNRSYAEITAPISGMVGRRQITEGNYIAGGSPAAPVLTTIVPYDPIYCEFEIDERQVGVFSELYLQEGAEKEQEVEIALSDEEAFDTKGVIVFGDNELNPSTATLRIRALVQNEGRKIAPGLFARVRVPMSREKEFLTLPETALGFEQARRFVWVVTPENTVTRRYLEVGDKVGDRRIILGGIEPSERIAVSGTQLLRPNLPVEPLPAES